MSALDDLPFVSSFFGLDLKTGSMIIAAIGIVHPFSYGCSFFMPISYLLATIWCLVLLYFVASWLLLLGVINSDSTLCLIYVWFSLVFVALMLVLMILLAVVFLSRRHICRLWIVLFAMCWYVLTIYFLITVNSYRQTLPEELGHNQTEVLNEKIKDKAEIVHSHFGRPFSDLIHRK